MTKNVPTFKILHANLAGHENIVAAVYDCARPERVPRVFSRASLKIESLRKPVKEAIRQARKRNSDVFLEFLPIEAIIGDE